MRRTYTAVSIIIILTLFIIQTVFANAHKPKDAFVVVMQSSNNIVIDRLKKKNRCERIFFDFFLEFARANDIKIEYKKFKKRDKVNALLSNEADFIFPDNPAWSSAAKRHKEVVYSDPVYYYIEGLFIRNENAEKFKDLGEVGNIGIVGDVVPWFLHHNIEINRTQLTQFSKSSTLIKALLTGEIDAAYSDFYLAKLAIKELKLENKIIFSKDLPNISDYYHLSTIKHPEIIAKFNLWINDHIHNFKKVIKKCCIEY